MRTIAVDFESFYESSKEDGACSIKTMGGRKYCADPRTDPYLISVSDGSETWAGHPRDFNFDSLDGQDLLSHNAGFDRLMAKEKILSGVMPKFRPNSWHCTANLSVYLCMRRDLLRAVEFLLGVTVDKSYRLDADGKTGEQLMADKAVWEKVLGAGRSDALRCHQLWSKYSHLWPEHERRLSELTIRQGHRGVQIDEPLLKKYLHAAQAMAIKAEENLPWISEGAKPRSTKALAEYCRKAGIPMAPVKKWDGEEAFDAWVAEYGPRHTWVKAFTDYAVINKFIKNCETFKERLDAEHVLSFDLLYFGAHTGRWAGSGGINFQNFRKEGLYCDGDALLITDEAKLKEIRSSKKLPDYVEHCLDIRKLIIPRPGKKMIVCDLAQIEARVLRWLAGDTAMLDMMRPTAEYPKGRSIYQAHAESTMGWTRGDMKELIKQGDGDAKDKYALAKARELGLGFGCGWRKFIKMAMDLAGVDITAEDSEFVQALDEDGMPAHNLDGSPRMVSGYGLNSQRVVNEYRESNPLITGMWKTLDDGLRSSIGSDFKIMLPSGRELRYPEVQRGRRIAVDPDTGKPTKKWETTALLFDNKRNGVVRTATYGGKLSENATQATAREIFGLHLLALDATPGIEVLFHAHDEAITEVDQHVTTDDVERIMSVTPEWMPGLPVAGEAAEVPCYMK